MAEMMPGTWSVINKYLLNKKKGRKLHLLWVEQYGQCEHSQPEGG